MGLLVSVARSFFTSPLNNRVASTPNNNLIVRRSDLPSKTEISKCVVIFLLSFIVGYGILVKMKEHFEPTEEQLLRKELAKFEEDMNLAPGSLNCMLRQWTEEEKKKTVV